MTTLVLVRHGHVEGIDPERFRGRTDLLLSELGQDQARRTAERIAVHWRASAVYGSPLARCVATADAIAGRLRLRAQAMDALCDLDYGGWTWKTHAEVRASETTLFERWLATPDLVRFPNGESLQDLMARAADAVRRLIGDHLLETVVLVGHDSVNRAILLQALQLPPSAYWRLVQSPCGVSEILIDHHRAQVVRMNETAHLED